jgi:hypothetical protein
LLAQVALVGNKYQMKAKLATMVLHQALQGLFFRPVVVAVEPLVETLATFPTQWVD